MKFREMLFGLVALSILLSGCAGTSQRSDEDLEIDPTVNKVLLGSKMVAAMEVKVAMLPPQSRRSMQYGNWVTIDPVAQAAEQGPMVDWEIKLIDPHNNKRLPYGSVQLVLKREGDKEISRYKLSPIFGKSGLYYGTNTALPVDGIYKVALSIDPPSMQRDMQTLDLWANSIYSEFNFVMENGLVVSEAEVLMGQVDDLPAAPVLNYQMLAGREAAGDIDVSLVVEEAVPLYMSAAGGLVELEPLEDELLLKVKLLANRVHSEEVAYTDVRVDFYDPLSGHRSDHVLEPLWTATGLYYAAFAAIPNGSYEVTVDVDVPSFDRQLPFDQSYFSSLFMEPVQVQFAYQQDISGLAMEPEIEAGSSRAYALQIGLFEKSTNVAKIKSRMQAEYIPLSQDQRMFRGKKVDRLRIGPYRNRQQARTLKSKLDEMFNIRTQVVPVCVKNEAMYGPEYLLQVGTFAVAENASRLAAKLSTEHQSSAEEVTLGEQAYQRVLLGPFSSRQEVKSLQPGFNRRLNEKTLVISACR